MTTRINPEVAHYTGQTELAEAIQEGLAAKASGDEETATLAKLSEELGISRERVRQLQREAERMLAGGEYGRAIGLAA